MKTENGKQPKEKVAPGPIRYGMLRGGPGEWGKWKLDIEKHTLEYPGGYYVDLQQCKTCAGMLDWIFQISHHRDFNNKDVADLLCAFEDIYDPQRTMCPFGKDHTTA